MCISLIIDVIVNGSVGRWSLLKGIVRAIVWMIIVGHVDITGLIVWMIVVDHVDITGLVRVVFVVHVSVHCLSGKIVV